MRPASTSDHSCPRFGATFMFPDPNFQALESVRPILKEGYRGVGLDRLLVGSPDTVLRRLAEYRDMGFGHVLVRHITGDHGPMLDSFSLIGRHVVPEISGWD